MNKKLTILQYCTAAFAVIFSVLQISFSADISLWAFAVSGLYTACLLYVWIVFLQKKQDASKLPLVRKLYQYLPFVLLTAFVLRRSGEKGTAYNLDAFTIFIWCAVFILSVIVLHYADPKRVFNQNEGLKLSHDKNPPVKRQGIKKIAVEILEWADAFVQAAFTVTLIQIFVFQLYEIPSESMVPEFLVKDRVAVYKTSAGPRFPLSDVGIPRMTDYERGDIVVFRNPHYSRDRESEVKNFAYQLVYMLTFTGVNLNVDETGQLKADPLVKRVTGIPGEQLMMQDGILYSRTADAVSFKPVSDDALWAEYNLSSVKPEVKSGIQSFPISSAQYDAMLLVERQRNALDLSAAAEEAAMLAERFAVLAGRSGLNGSASPASSNNTAADGVVQPSELFEFTLFRQHDVLTRRLLTVNGGVQWFESFMTSWAASVQTAQKDGLIGGSLYDDANFRLNVMIKLTFGRLAVRTAELIKSGIQSSAQVRDAERVELLKQAENLHLYTVLLDRRNMPVFPPNAADGSPSFIPADSYFMMGDNRFNSLDMRHSYQEKMTALTKYDEKAVTYYSNMSPQYVSSRDILGTAVLRFWPVKRFAVPGHTGK